MHVTSVEDDGVDGAIELCQQRYIVCAQAMPLAHAPLADLDVLGDDDASRRGLGTVAPG